MKLKIKSSYMVMCTISLLFITQGFGMSVGEAAQFKKDCIKSGGHVGWRDNGYVCAGGSVMPDKGKLGSVKIKKNVHQNIGNSGSAIKGQQKILNNSKVKSNKCSKCRTSI